MKSILFKNANLIDVKHRETLQHTDVLVSDGIISDIGSGLSANADETVDASGQFMTPGVIDMHVHSTWNGSPDPVGLDEKEGNYQAFLRSVVHAEKCLRAGVTTIRDVGSPADLAVETAYAVDKGYIKGCRIIPCGAAIQSIYGHVPQVGTIADTDGELQLAIRAKKELFSHKQIKCQWIKIMDTGGAAGLEDVGPSMYSDEQLNLIVKEARRLHMKTAVHAVSREGIIACIKAGIDTIEHGPDIPDEYLDMMKEKNLTLIPTLAIYSILAKSHGIIPDFMVERSEKVSEQQRDTFLRAMKKGVRIALGTDAGSPNFGPQPSAFREMLYMNEYGMPKEDVIASCTLTAAQVLGIDNEIGSLEIGKQADLLLLGENPYENLRAFTDSLVAVYKGGEKA